MSDPQPISPLTPGSTVSESQRAELTADIGRGLARLLHAHGVRAVPELVLATGRRADFAGLTEAGDIWIVEVKSGLADFRADAKWPEYRAYCDRLFFAVAPDFPVAILPEDTGLILADRFGGEIVRPAPEHRLAAARRKAVTLRIARMAALRLLAISDPDLGIDPTGLA